MSLTVSEKMFETLCQSSGIRYARVAQGKDRTPDYDIYLPRRKVVVEVKEIGPNPRERDAQRRLRAGESVVSGFTPGQRVRGKISDAAPQIRRRTQGRYPGFLVLIDTGFACMHTDSYQIRVAMYGLETVIFAVPHDRSVSPYVIDKKFGPKRKMTVSDNTSISAVAVMFQHPTRIDLRIYHNVHAAVPLPPALFQRYGAYQSQLANEQVGSVPDWVEI